MAKINVPAKKVANGVPAYLVKTGTDLGVDSINAEDMTIPRIKICQPLSEIKQNNDQHLTSMLETNFNRVFRELEELRRRVDELGQSPRQDQQPIEQPKSPPPNKPPEVQQPNQRTGDYSPEDVSIEKFFYAGEK